MKSSYHPQEDMIVMRLMKPDYGFMKYSLYIRRFGVFFRILFMMLMENLSIPVWQHDRTMIFAGEVCKETMPAMLWQSWEKS